MKLLKYLAEGQCIPKRAGKPVPIETIIAYHVTKVENVDSILKKGFDLFSVKPRWVNDWAVSCTVKSLQAAEKYFSMTGKPLNRDKYAVLKVIFRGRVHREYDDTSTPALAGSPQAYNREMKGMGYDAALLPNGHMYVYNVKAIEKVTPV